MINTNFPVPERIPGQLITNHQHLYFLKKHLANLCGHPGSRFPGSQPVSFTQKSLELLESEDFWVCEKSNGVRAMMFIVVKGTLQVPLQEVYFIDRKDDFYLIKNITFSHPENPNRLLKDTILDGELVIDVNPKTRFQQFRFLAFDCLVWEASNLMMSPLMNRYVVLKEWVIAPLEKLLNIEPHLRYEMPFDVQLKTMELAYRIDKVLHHDLPKLTHGNDGLIFTSATAPYQLGTDPKTLKWKPPSENSIDFRLELKFPPRSDDPSKPDFYAKPLFLLMMICGEEREKFFDTLEMPDEEWLQLGHNTLKILISQRKERREQLDNRVVEVVWDPFMQTWRILRFRDDKKHGNCCAVVFSTLDSIRDGVEAAELIKRLPKIRQAWNARAQTHSSNPQATGNESPPRFQQEFISRPPAPPKSLPRAYNQPSGSRPPPQPRQLPHATTEGPARPPFATLTMNVVGGNPKTKGQKKRYTMPRVGTVAATMKRI